jgi:hypothetical protein
MPSIAFDIEPWRKTSNPEVLKNERRAISSLTITLRAWPLVWLASTCIILEKIKLVKSVQNNPDESVSRNTYAPSDPDRSATSVRLSAG